LAFVVLPISRQEFCVCWITTTPGLHVEHILECILVGIPAGAWVWAITFPVNYLHWPRTGEHGCGRR
jgi:hypothetical protein